MNIFELTALAAGLSMDAFAVSACKGLAVGKAGRRDMLRCGLWFGGFQALMPVLGYFFGAAISGSLTSIADKVAFAVLCFIGADMLISAVRGKEDAVSSGTSPAEMLPTAIATSIDALAVGVSFAFLRQKVLLPAGYIGAVTFLFSAAGIRLGAALGERRRRAALAAGGTVLITLAAKILLT